MNSCLITPEVVDEIDRLSSLAPLHNPRALAWIGICGKIYGNGIPQVAIFDAAFYAHLPEVATTYALPRIICQQHNIRRYGFHGIAHGAMAAPTGATVRQAGKGPVDYSSTRGRLLHHSGQGREGCGYIHGLLPH